MVQASTRLLILGGTLALVLASPGAAHAADELLVVALAGEGRVGPRAARALAAIRAERALRQARGHYARSEFARCVAVLAQAEQELQGALLPETAARDLALLKRVNQWLGLCRSVGAGSARARADFALAARLPGEDPDPEVFPPPALALYRAASGARASSCAARVGGALELWLDGRAVSAGTAVRLGEHYAVWRTGGGDRGSGRLLVGADCALLPPRAAPPRALTDVESRDIAFLEALGREAGARRLLLVGRAPHLPQPAVFDVEATRFVAHRLAAHRAHRQLVPPPPAAAARPRATRATARRVRRSAWYRSWWVWALVGAGVAAAVAIPVAATSGPTTYDLSF